MKRGRVDNGICTLHHKQGGEIRVLLYCSYGTHGAVRTTADTRSWRRSVEKQRNPRKRLRRRSCHAEASANAGHRVVQCVDAVLLARLGLGQALIIDSGVIIVLQVSAVETYGASNCQTRIVTRPDRDPIW